MLPRPRSIQDRNIEMSTATPAQVSVPPRTMALGVYGLFGYAFFVSFLGMGISLLAGGLVLAAVMACL